MRGVLLAFFSPAYPGPDTRLFKTIPDNADQLAEIRKAQDEWLVRSGRRMLKTTGMLAGAAMAVLTAVIA